MGFKFLPFFACAVLFNVNAFACSEGDDFAKNISRKISSVSCSVSTNIIEDFDPILKDELLKEGIEVVERDINKTYASSEQAQDAISHTANFYLQYSFVSGESERESGKIIEADLLGYLNIFEENCKPLMLEGLHYLSCNPVMKNEIITSKQTQKYSKPNFEEVGQPSPQLLDQALVRKKIINAIKKKLPNC